MYSTLPSRMTNANELSPEKRFTTDFLPWIVAGGGLLVYLVTLSRWVSMRSLEQVAMVSGLSWQVPWNEPVLWLVTYPMRWLPAAVIPLALNGFSALCGALTLALLARSVALLPHDHTEQERIRERGAYALLTIRNAWVPPVLAAVVCGLQLTFWESATAISSDIFNLLLFGYISRCLLEFRVDGRDAWLFQAALVYGAAMANNWAMLAFFPVFLIALVWLKRLSFFDLGFLSRMFLLGLAGLCFLLVLPIANTLSGRGDVGFWDVLRVNLAAQKSVLGVFLRPRNLFQPDHPLWVLALPSLLPALAMSIRWPSYFGDTSKLGVGLANFTFNILYGLLLAVCMWVALDSRFSPRAYGLALLPFYYLGALAVGYFSGYVLLVFGTKPYGRKRLGAEGMPLVDGAVITGFWVLVAGTLTLLVHRNLPTIRAANGSAFKQFATAMIEHLPDQPAVVLSDDSLRLLTAQLLLAQGGQGPDHLFLDTAALEVPEYHAYLNRKYPGRWESHPAKGEKVDAGALFLKVFRLGQTNVLYYLHPSFGYYFEAYYAEPHGLCYKLVRFPTNALAVPEMSKDLVAENQAVWDRLDESSFKAIAAAADLPNPAVRRSFLDQLEKRAHLDKEPPRELLVLGRCYSRALNYWGVRLQRNGQLRPAAECFTKALELNPDNAVAQINLECNRNLQAGTNPIVQVSKVLEEQLGRYKNLDQAINDNGPFDEPGFCARTGEEFLRNGNYRQGAQEFGRVAEMLPTSLLAQLRLAGAYVLRQTPDEALKVVAGIRARPELYGLGRTNQGELLRVETTALLQKKDLAGAEGIFRKALAENPGDPDVLATATHIYMTWGYSSNALAMVQEELKVQPDSPGALVNLGLIWLRLSAYTQAIPPLTKVVDMGTNAPSDENFYYSALFNRAIAFLQNNQSDQAQQDYLVLEKRFPDTFQVEYGLGEAAYRRRDTNAAIKHFNAYLSKAPTNLVEEIFKVRSRLNDLRSGS